MRIEKIVKIKNLFQGLKFDKLYIGRNAMELYISLNVKEQGVFSVVLIAK